MDLGMIVLARGRKPLNMGMLVSVAIGAALIILTNGILCVFLLRDKKLWKIVREVVKKKNGLFTVRLTVRVDPPLPPPLRSGCCDFFKISLHILTYFTIL